MFSSILAVGNLSPSSWASIPYVRALASNFGSQVHFLGIVTETKQVWDRSLEQYLAGLVQDLGEGTTKAKTSVVHGNPAVEVVRYCGEHGIDLIATTAGKSNNITCSIIGAIARRMSLTLNVATLMVPARSPREAGSRGPVAFQRMLVPMDCLPTGEAILPYIETIAKVMGSSVTLLHVNAPSFRPVPVMHHEVIRMSRYAGEVYIKNICKRLRERGLNSECEVVDGRPATTILKYADEKQFDLIAMSTRGLSGIEGWVFGSVTNRVCEGAKVPVLAISAHSGN